jgi:hypothetical protein
MKEGMINVVSRCQFEGCNNQPSFNFPNENKEIFCKEHKRGGMINVIEKRKCQFEGCNKQPSFNFPNESKGLFCLEHKREGMIDVKNKRCQFEGSKKLLS